MVTGSTQSMLVIVAVPYLALAATAFTMSRDAQARPRWEWLWAFGGLYALHLWVPLSAVVPGLSQIHWLSGLLVGLAYLSLLEFARTGGLRHAKLPRWVTGIAILGLLALILTGHGAEHWTVSLLLGVPSGLLAMAMLLTRRRELGQWGGTWALLLGISLLLIPVVSCAEELLPPESVGQGVGVCVAGAIAALSAVLLDAWRIHGRRGSAAASNYTTNVLTVALVLGVLLTAGIAAAQLLAGAALHEVRSVAQQQDSRIATMISVAHTITRQTADSISGSPLVLRRIEGDSPDAVAGANSILDRYARSFNCDAAYLLDAQGIVLASSDRGRPDSHLGAHLADREYFRRALAGENYSAVRLGTITRTRGIYASAPVRDAAGKVVGVAVIKNELESLERQLGTEDRIALVDPGGTIWLTTQPQWLYQRMWDRERPGTAPAPRPIPGQPSAELRDLPNHPLQSQETVMLGGEACEVHRTAAGPEGWSLVSFSPIRPVLRTRAIALLVTACGVLVTLGVASSVRLRAEHAAAHQQEQALTTSLKEMERLMSVLSHDLRAPLAAAHCSAEYLLALPETHGEPREILGIIAEQQMRMGEMVGRMLDAIRIRNGAMEWSWENVAVPAVLQSAHRTVNSLPTRSPAVQVELDATQAPATILGDAQAIGRLVTNLATNAVRHTKEGAVRIAARSQQIDGMQWLVIETSDTGGGIAPAMLPLLGRPFVLGGKQGGAGGSGLGLAIAAGICAAHGGRLMVRSEVGRGTTFTAWLRADLPGPVRVAAEPTIQVENAAH